MLIVDSVCGFSYGDKSVTTLTTKNQGFFSFEGLMISGLARGAQVLGEDVYEKRAIKAAEFVRKYLFDEKSGQLLRSCYRGDSGEVMQM